MIGAMQYLPSAPRHVVHDGQPLQGRYAGRIDRIDWQALQGPHAQSWLWQRLHHKRWQYVGIGNDEVFIGVAIVDLGWMCTAFAYAFDRVRHEVVANWRQDGIRGLQGGVSDQPVHGAKAWFKGPFARLRLTHGAAPEDGEAVDGDILELSVRTRAMKVQVDLSLADAAPFLLGIGPVDGGVAHATQKSSALPVSGWLNVRGRRFDLSDAVACVDSSNGLLARDTAWRWACGHRADIGFNLQQGYFGNNENALWLDGQLIPLGTAHFAFDPRQPMTPWRVHTEDGLLDLVFTPEGARREDRNVGIAASHYVQPVGTFDGWVKASPGARPREVKGLLGVTEDHRSRW
jgi:phage protein U